jgi:hypothetical protein
VSLDVELLVRIAAAVAALALVASPVVVATYKQAGGWLAKRPTTAGKDSALHDMTTVLEIANRLRLAGCEDGVDLCEKLISVMLAASPPKE